MFDSDTTGKGIEVLKSNTSSCKEYGELRNFRDSSKAGIYKIGDHDFSQRDGGLYMCEEGFPMSLHECVTWKYKADNDGYQLVTRKDEGVYWPMAVYMPGKTERYIYDAYVESVCKDCNCCIVVADKNPYMSTDYQQKSVDAPIAWCRDNAPEAIKELPDDELWDIMKTAYLEHHNEILKTAIFRFKGKCIVI